MRAFIKDMLTDDKTGRASSTRVAGFIALFWLVLFCVAILVVFLIKGSVDGLSVIVWGFVSVVISLFLGKVAKDFSGSGGGENYGEQIG